jgi:hypothetical protein
MNLNNLEEGLIRLSVANSKPSQLSNHELGHCIITSRQKIERVEEID